MTKQQSNRLSIIPAAAVFDERLSNADIRVFAALGAHADKHGRCWPATAALASDLRVSTRHIRRCLRNLENCGYVEIQQQRRSDGGNAANLYRLL